MVKRMYAVKDCKTSLYDRVLLAVSDGEMIRSFSDVANDKQSVIGLHPNDFRIDYLGEWDQATGQFRPVEPMPLVEAAQLVNK